MTEAKKDKPSWSVTLSVAAAKMKQKLPAKISALLYRLLEDIGESGPIQRDWKNFSELEKSKRVLANSYHCHLKKGRPTYVACWRVNKEAKKVEVYYVGTHENAPY